MMFPEIYAIAYIMQVMFFQFRSFYKVWDQNNVYNIKNIYSFHSRNVWITRRKFQSVLCKVSYNVANSAHKNEMQMNKYIKRAVCPINKVNIESPTRKKEAQMF